MYKLKHPVHTYICAKETTLISKEKDPKTLKKSEGGLSSGSGWFPMARWWDQFDSFLSRSWQEWYHSICWSFAAFVVCHYVRWCFLFIKCLLYAGDWPRVSLDASLPPHHTAPPPPECSGDVEGILGNVVLAKMRLECYWHSFQNLLLSASVWKWAVVWTAWC